MLLVQKKKKKSDWLSWAQLCFDIKKKKNTIWIIASFKDVCPLKSREAVILFCLVKGNMVMSHDSVRVPDSLADGQVFLFVSLLCFATEYRNSCFSSECRRTCFAVVNKKMPNSNKEEITVGDLVEWEHGGREVSSQTARWQVGVPTLIQ